jgi:hypothetical protein
MVVVISADSVPWLPESADMTTTMPLAPRRSFPMTQHPTWNMSQGFPESSRLIRNLVAFLVSRVMNPLFPFLMDQYKCIQLLALSSSGSHNIGVMGQSVSVNATSFRFSLGSGAGEGFPESSRLIRNLVAFLVSRVMNPLFPFLMDTSV